MSYVVFLLALPFLSTHPKLRQGFRVRLGLDNVIPPRAAQPGTPKRCRIWVHGASAGDILALLPTVRALKKERRDLDVVVSTITNSGRAMAERQGDLFLAVTYFPYDVPYAVRRAMRHIDPDVLILEYTELWPQLVRTAAKRKIPMVLHNGRLSERSKRRYRWLFGLTGNLLLHLNLFLMRDEHEAERVLSLGAPPNRVHITGNTKFDSIAARPSPEKISELDRSIAFPKGAPVWVAGSTHDGEEDIILDVYCRLRSIYPGLRLVLAPRYTERCERLATWVARRGLRPRLRSCPGPAPDVLILDTIGELPTCYAIATLVFVGGSFVARGGQNILEPAGCGKPVLFGPFMHNFADSVQVLLGRGGIQVANGDQLYRVMADLLEHPEHRQELGEIARTQVGCVSGAAQRNAQLIETLLKRAKKADRRAS